MSEVLLPDMSLVGAIRTRRSVRGFLEKPVPQAIIEQAFLMAQLAPSNCNTQPWKAYVASGKLRDTISQQLQERARSGAPARPDFDYSNKFEGEYRKRQIECAAAMYGEMDIARDDRDGRARAGMRNFELFDAPHVVFIGMDVSFGATISLDVGMFSQNLMLMLTAYGIGSCAMGSLRHQPDIIRKAFGLDDSIGILFGIAFGYEDADVPANNTRVSREPLANTVTFQC